MNQKIKIPETINSILGELWDDAYNAGVRDACEACADLAELEAKKIHKMDPKNYVDLAFQKFADVLRARGQK